MGKIKSHRGIRKENYLFVKERGGLCSRHIRNILSACAVWFTFIYRKPTHLAVGSSGTGLTGSRGLSLFRVAVPSPVVFIVPQFLWLVKRISQFL